MSTQVADSDNSGSLYTSFWIAIAQIIGNIPPAEDEEHYYAMLEAQPMAA